MTTSHTVRLLYAPPLEGKMNMATDQAIMEAVGDERVLPTLRFYGWQPPCLSLGYTQKLRDVDLDRLNAKSWGLVRRPTGGRAILHTDELTYSLSLPQNHPLVGGEIVTSYRRISAALKVGLEKLGIQPETAPYERQRGQNSPVCFETPAAYEITVNGQKLIGSAQVRRQKAVLQHGTLPLTGDIARICEALVYPDELAREQAKIQVRERATTLERVLGRAITWQQAAHALQTAFAEVFGWEFSHEELTPAESLRIEQLRAETYNDPVWLEKR